MAKQCINPTCEKEIPGKATFCSFCGTQQVGNENLSEEEKMRKEMSEMQETIVLLKKALADTQQNYNIEEFKKLEHKNKILCDDLSKLTREKQQLEDYQKYLVKNVERKGQQIVDLQKQLEKASKVEKIQQERTEEKPPPIIDSKTRRKISTSQTVAIVLLGIFALLFIVNGILK